MIKALNAPVLPLVSVAVRFTASAMLSVVLTVATPFTKVIGLLPKVAWPVLLPKVTGVALSVVTGLLNGSCAVTVRGKTRWHFEVTRH